MVENLTVQWDWMLAGVMALVTLGIVHFVVRKLWGSVNENLPENERQDTAQLAATQKIIKTVFGYVLIAVVCFAALLWSGWAFSQPKADVGELESAVEQPAAN